jgi:glycosyltransferase involved in cell wall biosynthesis
MRFLLANWTSIDETKGGCESVFDDLRKLITGMGHEAKAVSFDKAKVVMGLGMERKDMNFFEAEASHVIDRYCHQYLKLYPGTRIISNAGVTNFWYKNPNTTNIFNDPYRTIVDRLLRLGVYGSPTYNKIGNICVLMQKEGGKGARNIAVSDFMADEMERIGVRPDRTIAHGVDTERFKPMDKEKLRKKYGVPDGVPVVVWSKDFHPVAGFSIISHLVNKFQDVHWVLNFKYKQNYKPRLKNVTIVQPVGREVMPEIYNLGDFLINPSVTESFGLVPLEAMSCDIPCILSNTGLVWERGMKKDIEERPYGILVDPWTSQSYEKAVEMMLEDGRKYGPRKWVMNNGFTKERWERDWKGLIGEICKEKS